MAAGLRTVDMTRIALCAFLLVSLLAAGSGVAALPEEAEAGRALYREWCAGCHGAEGMGDGPAADYLVPRPRNFADGAFKIRSTVSGELPTDADILKVIREGMPGTSMPGWEGKFSDQQLRELVAYVKTLIDMELFEEGEPEQITVGEPIPSSEESLARGRELYRKLKCWECHGEEGRGDGPSAPTLTDDWGYPIVSADLTKGWTFRGGDSASDIYRTFTTGLNGTPMPSYMDTIGEEDRWHLSNYVKSLSPSGMPSVKAVLTSRRVREEIPQDPDHPFWQQGEDAFYPLAGQIVFRPRMFTPSIDSVLVKSVYNDREIAFRLVWNDRTRSVPQGEGDLPDALGLQFPAQFREGERPHFVMGDAAKPVNIWKWAAGGDNIEEANARGIGKYSPQEPRAQGLRGKAVYRHGQWKLVVKRSLTTEEEGRDVQFVPGEFIPIAYLAWDGDNGESGGRMALSSWYYLVLEKSASAGVFLFTPLAVLGAVGLQFLARRQVRRSAGDRQ